jgi:hypothetical protein
MGPRSARLADGDEAEVEAALAGFAKVLGGVARRPTWSVVVTSSSTLVSLLATGTSRRCSPA